MEEEELAKNHAYLQNLIPTCQRCHRQRRKCDTDLPACRLCKKANVECMIFDHALQESRPRAYVQELVARLERLKAIKARLEPPSRPDVVGSYDQHTIQGLEEMHYSNFTSPAAESQPSHSRGRAPLTSFDVHFNMRPDGGKTTRFFGASSVFSMTVELLDCAYSRGIASAPLTPVNQLDSFLVKADTKYVAPSRNPPLERLKSLISLYFDSMNTLYGFIEQTATEADLQSYTELMSHCSFNPRSLSSTEAHRYFRISMICAIACANKARYDPGELAHSMTYYADALSCVEEVTSEVSAESLQALLLLIVFCLFHPRKGDIWKLLDYACRLSIELGYHTEVSSSNDETDNQRDLRRSTFWGLYAIERIVGQLFGRGSDLPEAIITTHYPNIAPNAIIPSEQALVDSGTMQAISIAHHYRLVYLRSEIYRDLYLAAEIPQYTLDWYRARLETLQAWRNELHVGADNVGVATITCDVGYHSTICFLFQPLMLSGLRNIRKVPFTNSNGEQEGEAVLDTVIIPQDNYFSACALIQIYEKIVRSPQNSALGAYPVTFLSAHYIYLAALTLMAHCLLALDKRVVATPVMSRSLCNENMTSNSDSHIQNAQGIGENCSFLNFTSITEVSSSCLILLTWCSERWPEMVSMLEVYKQLSNHLIPALIRAGYEAT